LGLGVANVDARQRQTRQTALTAGLAAVLAEL